MKIKESSEMYLETILILSKSKKEVRSIDVGEYMGYTKPSVSRAMGILKKANFIEMDGNGYISLTEEGRAHAEKIYERHRLLTQYLVEIGVDEKTASEDACKIEHVISDKTFEKMKEHAVQKR